MLDTYRKTDLALKLYESTQNIIRFADTKINALSVINGIATSYILTNFQQIYSVSLFSKVLLVFYLCAFFVFVYFLLNTILPRGTKGTANEKSQTVYFGDISNRENVTDYIKDFNTMTDEDFLEDLLCQIYESSRIASTKFKNYKKSLMTVQVQIFLFFILLAVKSFS